jgi:exo-beta-1,3-glucanase (GH17 family)
MYLRIFLCLLAASSLVARAAPAGIATILAESHWIAYAPNGYYPNASPPVVPSRESLRTDLTVLHDAGFTGLITYGATLPMIADVAQQVGFRAMLLGVWDPFDPAERARALQTVNAHSQLIVGIIVGNEGLMTGRYTIERLCSAMGEIRAVTRKPVSTTEPVDFALSEQRICECSDFITVNAHPYFSNQKEPHAAVLWTQQASDAVHARYPRKPALLKEVGLPTAGDAVLSENTQAEYYKLLAATDVPFAYFEAYDSHFKTGAIEQSWGLWHADRTPKPVVGSLPWRNDHH